MKDRLKVGLFIDTFFPMIDGVIMVVDNYARRLQKYCDVVVFAPKGRKDYDDSKLPYKVVRCKSKFPLVFLDYDLPLPNRDKEFKRELENSNLDIVHIHSPFSIGKMGVKYAQKHNIPAIATMHSQFRQDFKKAVKLDCIANMMVKKIMKVFNACTECWTMNNACVELLRSFGYKGVTGLVPNATDLIPSPEIDKLACDIRAKYASDGSKLFVNIGRLIKLKDIDIAIDTMKELQDRSFKAKLFIIGTGKDKKYFENKVNKLGLQDSVIFLGRIVDASTKAAYCKAADLHFFPSRYDTDGIVKIEAAGFDTPTLFSKGSMASSVCQDGVDGYIEEFDKSKFADKIIDIFADPTKYEEVCINANKSLYRTWDDIVSLVYEKYKTIKEKK